MSATIQDLEMHAVACPLCGGESHAPERTIDEYTLVRCACGFVYVNPQPTSAALDEIYSNRHSEAVIEFYNATRTSSMIAEYTRWLEVIERIAGGKGKLLDFGCGPCFFLQQAQELGWDADGVDMGPWVEEAARRRGVKNVFVGMLEHSAISQRRYDVIVAMEVFEHLSQPRSVLQMLREHLRPGGLLFLTVPNYRCLSIVLGRDDFWRNRPPQHLNYYTPKSMQRLLADCGFRVRLLTSGHGLKLGCVLGRKFSGADEPPVQEPPVQTPPANGNQVQPAEPNSRPAPTPGRKPLWKRVVWPVVSELFYSRAKVGMSMFAIAQRDG